MRRVAGTIGHRRSDGPGAEAGGAGGPPGAFAQVPRRGKANDPIRAAPGPDDPALGSRPADGCLSGVISTTPRRVRPVVRLPEHLAAAPDGLVVRLADPAVAAAAARRGHGARGARPGPDPRPDPRRVRPADLPRPAQRGRGLGQGPQVQERLARRSTRPSATTSGS